jgi:hypothetical protein
MAWDYTKTAPSAQQPSHRRNTPSSEGIGAQKLDTIESIIRATARLHDTALAFWDAATYRTRLSSVRSVLGATLIVTN